MSRKNPISFAFSVLFEIAAVVAIVSVLPRINLRPSVAASQPPLETLPLQMTDLRIPTSTTPPRPSWTANTAGADQHSAPALLPRIDATPASPQYVEQQLDRASQRLLNTVGGAVNQASHDWLRPVQQQAPPLADSGRYHAASGAGYALENSTTTQTPTQSTHKPVRWPTAAQRTAEPRAWLRY